VEEGGATVSCDKGGGASVGTPSSLLLPLVIEEEGRSNDVPPWTGDRERERVIAAALNLGEIEMNGRERLYGRERVSWEKRKRVMDAAARCAGEEKERERWVHMCVRKHTIRVTHFLASDWLR
jgi:hypothetical protein